MVLGIRLQRVIDRGTGLQECHGFSFETDDRTRAEFENLRVDDLDSAEEGCIIVDLEDDGDIQDTISISEERYRSLVDPNVYVSPIGGGE